MKIGSTNETDLVVLAGLQADDEVVLNVSDEQVMELLELPEEEES